MAWYQLSFDAPREQAQRLAAALELAGALSVTFGDAGDEPQLEPGPGETPLWSQVTLSALFEASEENRLLIARLVDEFAPQMAGEARIEKIEDRAWERVWLDTFHPTRFGRRLWVCPHGQRPDDDADAVILSLDPGLAFGTGHHPTTALCLEWLDGADLAGRTVLDYGCGSGILSIAALLLGAERAIGVDHDVQALEATRDNAAVNGVAERLEVLAPDELAADFQADVLVANILAGPLVSLAPRLIGHLCPHGPLALSGVLATQAADVRAAYEPAITFEPTVVREDWVLLAGRRGTRS